MSYERIFVMLLNFIRKRLYLKEVCKYLNKNVVLPEEVHITVASGAE